MQMVTNLNMGQTRHSLRVRYREHIQSIKFSREDSGFTTHILRNTHQCGKMEDIFERTDHSRKGPTMNTKEIYNDTWCVQKALELFFYI
jgi:hypothetical protein